MADVMRDGFVRDDASGILVVQGPGGAAAAGGRILGSLVKTDADFTTANAAFTDITGLTGLVIAVGTRPIIVEFTAASMSNATAAQFAGVKIDMDAGTNVGQTETFKSTNANDAFPCYIKSLLSGLSVGNHTFKVQLSAPFGGTAKVSRGGGGASGQMLLTVREA